jgi:zinc protease
MRYTKIFTAILMAGLTTVVMAQPKFIEKVTRKGSELIISYEKYQLANGLTILVHEDHSDPIVYVDVTYHVGSAREQEGRSGFAHFFEHMMFQGSEHVADEEHFKIVTEAGGSMNGTTTNDRTNYFEVLPSNQLETALWLESDRMGFLLDAVTQKKFEVQRETVKNERGQNYDNKPYGLVREKLGAALYPSTHPYSWLPIGYIEDLNRVNVTDLKNFFMRWYGPNNATLTVAGDVNPADVIKFAEKYFGTIPRGPEVQAQHLPIPTLDKDRYISYEDNIRSPQITYNYPTIPSKDPDEAPLDVLADILAGGKSSIFYKNFEKSQLAQFASVYNSARELGGEFSITIRTFPDKSLAQMDSLVRASLVEFEKRGVTEDDLKKYKAGYEAAIVGSLSSVRGKGASLANAQTFTNNPNYLAIQNERYNKVTKEDVMRVYNKYIKNKYAAILSVCPKGKLNLAAAPDNYTLAARNTSGAEASEYRNLVYTKAKDTFDRNKKPVPPAASLVKSPPFWKKNFENGLKIIGAKNDEVPNVNIQLSIETGHRFEPINKSGEAELLADLLNESTTSHSAEQLAEKLERLGSSVYFSSNSQNIILSISSLLKNVDSTLAIAEEMLFHPKFDAEDFDRLKKQSMEAIANQTTQATTIANNAYAKLLYGKDHVMGIPALGTQETLNRVTLEDIKKRYQDSFSPAMATAVIVGDISEETILPKLNFLKTWKGNKVTHNEEPALPKIDKTRIYLVNKEKAPQSEIRIGYMAMPYDATGEFYKMGIMNYTLGGAFSSRINLNLREEHGYTYGARSGFSGNKFAGPFTASAGVRANVTDSSIIEFMKEIKNYADNGIKQDELSFTTNSIGQSDALNYETAWQKA